MSDKLENILFIVIDILILAVTIFFIVALPLMIQDEIATIKVKERLAEDGIVITNTQVEKLLEENK